MKQYNKESEIPQQFLCLICSQICKLPLTCNECWSLQCYDCVVRNNNICGRGCQESFEYILTAFDYFQLDNIQIKCKYCLEYIKYRKYRQHNSICKQIYYFKTFKLNSKFKLISEITVKCKSCKIIAFIPYQCQGCKKISCDLCIKNKDCCLQGFMKVLPEVNCKIRCKSCICTINYKDIKQHLKYQCKRKKIKQYYENYILPFFKIFQQSIKLKDINEQTHYQYDQALRNLTQLQNKKIRNQLLYKKYRNKQSQIRMLIKENQQNLENKQL